MRDDLVEPEPWTIEGTNVVAKGKRRIAQLPGVKTFNFDWPEQTEVTTRLRDVLEPVVDERYYLSEEKTAKLVAQLEATTDEKGEPKLTQIASLNLDGYAEMSKSRILDEGISRTLMGGGGNAGDKTGLYSDPEHARSHRPQRSRRNQARI